MNRGGIAFVVGMLVGAPVACANFVAGHFYTPMDGGVINEWDEQLHLVGHFTVAGLGVGSGAVFNDAGNLVVLGQRQGTTQVIELSSTGSIVRAYDTGLGSFLRGAYIDFDAPSGRYVFANGRQISVLDHNLSLVGSSTSVFQRASGVAFGAGGVILATDQFGSLLRRFDATTLIEQTPLTIGGFVRTGLDVNANDDLFLTDFGNGNVQRLAGESLPLITLVSGLGYGRLSDIRVLPDGSFVTITTAGGLKQYTSAGMLLRTGADTNFSDGIAYFVPAPNVAAALSGCLGIAAMRRRPRYRRALA